MGCDSDLECPTNQQCRNRACVNPCQNNRICGSFAICSTSNHVTKCHCPSGMTGDPSQECLPSKIGFKYYFSVIYELAKPILFTVKTGECQRDSDCPDDRLCTYRYQCRNPCIFPHDACGRGATCEPINHRAVCHCPVGLVGNPHENCYKRKLISPWIFSL